MAAPKPRILHVSTAHRPHDPRIVYKQCPTLAERYEVWCAIPHADPTTAPAVRFVSLPYFRRVWLRALLTGPLIVWRCWRLRPRVVHLYVPEFIPFAFLFRLRGAAIIYEVQENLFKKLHLKTHNRHWLLRRLFGWFDALARRHFYCLFTEHGYLTTYQHLAKPHVVIYNYPLLPFLDAYRQPYAPQPDRPVFFYIGWLSFERAVDTLVAGLAGLKRRYPNVVAHLFGSRTFSDADLARLPDYAPVQTHLHFHGYADQRLAWQQANNVVAGLALLKPVGDYPESYTTKMFEYMALGWPVVTSDFPLYRNVVERHACGFCIAPDNPAQLTDCLTYLTEHPAEARAMGERGRAAVEAHYTWQTEARKLLDFYELILQ